MEVHDNSGAASSADNRLPMCSITISFDQNTQKLWDDLHLPYETYTSFFRHLILLEKYFRNGDLVLSDSASTKASSYIRSLQNRIEEFEVKHKRSHAELSASTRPDLSVPPEPGLDCRLPAVAIGKRTLQNCRTIFHVNWKWQIFRDISKRPNFSWNTSCSRFYWILAKVGSHECHIK